MTLKFIEKTSLKRKLLASTVLLLIMTLVVGVSGYRANHRGTQQIGSLYGAMRRAQALGQIEAAKSDIAAALWNAYSDYRKGSPGPDSVLKSALDAVAEVDNVIDGFGVDGLDMKAAWTKAKEGTLSLVAAFRDATQERFSLRLRLDGVTASLASLTKQVLQAEAQVAKRVTLSYQWAQGHERGLLFFALIALFCCAVIGGWSSYFGIRAAREISRMTSSIRGSSGEVSTASGQLGVMSQSLAERVAEQAAALDESVASMEQMSSMIMQTAKSAESALENAQSAQSESTEGFQVIKDLQRSMAEIGDSNRKLDTINEIIKQISAKTAVINEIVFETRLLSFNASIEAARAGQHGRGFAVVAEEVGNLAKMSGKAAEEIKELLEKSGQQVTSTIAEIGEKVKMGQQISVSCADAFNRVGDSISKLTPLVNQISTAAKEQEAGVSQVNKALEQMDVVTNQNAKSAEEMANSGKTLKDQADRLEVDIAALNAIILGTAGPGARTHQPPSEPGSELPAGDLGERDPSRPIVHKIRPRKDELPSPDDPRFAA